MHRLYYTDSYSTRFQSPVIAVSEDRLRVTLEQTAFYPTSGGQPHDLGTLNNIAVVDVVDEGENIIHVLAAPLSGQTVEGVLDWSRRYDHMQQHTGQHLLSAVFEELFQMPTLSFHLGGVVSSIELGKKDLSPTQIDSVTLRATELARTNLPISITFEDAGHAQGLRKASAREGILRIIEIPGIDRSACGGTHVATLAEVLPLQIRDVEKVRANIRISFVCGNRAIKRAQSDFQSLARAAKSLTIAPDLIDSQILSLQQRLSAAEKRKLTLEIDIATRAGFDLYLQTIPAEDGVRRLVTAEPVIDEAARTKAKSFAAQAKAVILLHSPDALLLACSPDAGINAGALLKESLAKVGARGGGSPTLAQGNLIGEQVLHDLMQSAGLNP